MNIEIIIEPNFTPDELAELAVVAEGYGIRALWSSNYAQQWDGFISLVPAALATKKILLGPLAVSPYEMHPLKIATSVLTLNEISQGRAMVGISGGGGVLKAIGYEMDPKKRRVVRGVREAIEIVKTAATGQFPEPYEGELYQIVRPYRFDWVKAAPPTVYACSTEPQMLRMGARVADGIHMSDVALPMLGEAMENIQTGLAKRATPAEDFRITNFWAWHIKEDREASFYEARRELVFRGSLLPPYSLHHFLNEEDAQLVIDHWLDFAKAFWTRTGVVDNVPESIVNHLINELSSAGDHGDIDREIERLQKFKEGGLTDLSIRLFDDPMAGLKLIGERVVPAFA